MIRRISASILVRISHQLPAAADDAPRPAVLSRIGMLDGPTPVPSELTPSAYPPFGRSARSLQQSTTPRPSGRKPHWTRHLAALATKAGKKCGLGACSAKMNGGVWRVVWPLSRRIFDPYNQYEPANPPEKDLKRPAKLRRSFLRYRLLVLILLVCASADAGQRIIAIGDVHGSFEGLVNILTETQIIDRDQNWIAENLVLVQTGDLLDRGRDVRKVMDLFISLQTQAPAHGSQVIVLLGNHEAMNMLGILRDVNPEVYEDFTDKRSKRRITAAYREYKSLWRRISRRIGEGAPSFDGVKERWYQSHPPGFIEYVASLAADGPYGQWLRTCPASVKLGDTVFVHGGPGPSLAGMSIDDVNSEVASELAAFDLVHSWCEANGMVLQQASIHELVLATGFIFNNPEIDLPGEVRDAINHIHSWESWLLIDSDGPLWFRGAAMWIDERQSEIDILLTNLDARRIVIGHTPQRTGTIRSRFQDSVYLIDTGMLQSVYKGGQTSALEITDDTVSAIYMGKKELLSDNMQSPIPTAPPEETELN